MGGFIELSVYMSCLSLLFNFYSIFIILFGVFGHFILFLLMSCGLFGIVLRYRIPKPVDSTIHNIFGTNWGSYKLLPDNLKIDNDYTMKVVGHRACGLDAPENGLSALKKIHKEGIQAVEFDVMLTSDNQAIVFHDTSLLRLTNCNKNVEELTLKEIKELDISVNHPFHNNFEGEKIPTLKEFTKFCVDHQIKMFIDLKTDIKKQKELVNIINELFMEYPKLYNSAVVSSFNPFTIYKIRAKDPKIACSLAWRPYFYSHEDFGQKVGPTNPRTTNLFYLLLLRLLNIVHEWVLWTFGYYVLGLSALLLHKDMISWDIIHYWTKRGIRVIAWSVNLPTEKQYFEKILEITYLTDTVINS